MHKTNFHLLRFVCVNAISCHWITKGHETWSSNWCMTPMVLWVMVVVMVVVASRWEHMGKICPLFLHHVMDDYCYALGGICPSQSILVTNNGMAEVKFIQTSSHGFINCFKWRELCCWWPWLLLKTWKSMPNMWMNGYLKFHFKKILCWKVYCGGNIDLTITTWTT